MSTDTLTKYILTVATLSLTNWGLYYVEGPPICQWQRQCRWEAATTLPQSPSRETNR